MFSSVRASRHFHHLALRFHSSFSFLQVRCADSTPALCFSSIRLSCQSMGMFHRSPVCSQSSSLCWHNPGLVSAMSCCIGYGVVSHHGKSKPRNRLWLSWYCPCCDLNTGTLGGLPANQCRPAVQGSTSSISSCEQCVS